MFYKLVNKFLLLIDSISVAFGFISGSFSFLLGYKLALLPSLRNEKYPRNTLQNRLELIYRTYLFGGADLLSSGVPISRAMPH